MWPQTYRPFLDPLPIWVQPWIWPLLLIPLCAAVAVVYKSIRTREVSQIPREALLLFFMILMVMAFAASALAGLARIMQ